MEENFRQELMCPLTADELNGYSRELARATAKLITLREQKTAASAEFNAQIKEVNVEIRELATKINQGYECRYVDVRWEYDWDTGRKQLRRLDSMDLVIGQIDISITPEEGQRKLFAAENTAKAPDLARKPDDDSQDL